VNVTIYGVALCERVFGHDATVNYYQLGHGFLLHDLGKSMIDQETLNKPSSLSKREWEAVRNHPEVGYDILEAAGDVSEEVRVIVLQHHERYAGGGYPQELKGEEIHPYGRICCIADVFDALCTHRAYSPALSTFEALRKMREEMRGHFDPDYFWEFVLLFDWRDGQGQIQSGMPGMEAGK
jgi:HD-GYP domain-containing protein (c-di-GMP phosphodiesterase class II)